MRIYDTILNFAITHTSVRFRGWCGALGILKTKEKKERHLSLFYQKKKKEIVFMEQILQNKLNLHFQMLVKLLWPEFWGRNEENSGKPHKRASPKVVGAEAKKQTP